jgi:hypothetical protein
MRYVHYVLLSLLEEEELLLGDGCCMLLFCFLFTR